jgi:Predicted glycosyltransferase
MLQEVLTLGDKIDIRRLDRNGQPAYNARTYVSQLVDFMEKDVIHIATPIMNSALIVLNIGESYNLCFYTVKGLFQCSCVILQNYKDNNTVIAVVRITSNLEKLQRRQYYRLECILDLMYHIVTKEEETLLRLIHANEFHNNEERSECMKLLEKLEDNWLTATVIDISGGGVRFNSSSLLNQGDRLKIKMDLFLSNLIRKIELNANVVSSGKIMNRSDLFENRVEFKDISKKDREDLIKFVFEQERKRRK